MEGFAPNNSGGMPFMTSHHALDADDFFGQSSMIELTPPNLEQLAAMGAKHEPQLNMNLFYGTPFYDPYHPSASAMELPQTMLMHSMPTHMLGHQQQHMQSRDNGTPTDMSSMDHSAGIPPAYSLAAAPSQDAALTPVKSNRGRKPLPRTNEERMLATQEKNRRAQRKFRERQKERMKSMEYSVGSLTDQVKSLSVEVEHLSTQNSVLEKVLKLRNETIDKYQCINNVFPNTPKAPRASTSTESGHSVQGDQGPASSPQVLELLSGNADAVKRFQGQSFEELSEQWRQHISELAPLLKQHDCEPEGDEQVALLTKIKANVDAADQLTMLMGLFTPTFLSLLTAGIGCETVLASRGNEVEWWKHIVPLLELTDQQVHEALSLHENFCERYTKVLSLRRQLVITMQSAISADISAFETRSVAKDVYRLNRLAHMLGQNFKDEHSAGMDYVATLFKNVLTPLQMARVYSSSLPLFPDALSLTKAIAELADPSAANSVPLPLANTLQGAEDDVCVGPA